MPTPLLAAALIVRDEAEFLPGCLDALAALGPLIQQVVVYDTGSTDATRELARAAGATVIKGYWDDDFGRARNAALAATDASWVLMPDADERVVADPVRLAQLLRAGLAPGSERDAVVVPLVNLSPDGTEMYAAPLVRLLRPDRARYAGRLHERVEPLNPAPAGLRLLEPGRDVLHLRHLGYRDAAAVAAKAERNLRLADAEVAVQLTGVPLDADALVRALYQRGRTQLSAGRVQEALADLEQLRRTPARAAERIWGLDVLAQTLLSIGRPDDVPDLVAELRAAGVDRRYCSWLLARGLLTQDRFAEALPLLREVDAVIDAVGREHGLVPVLEAQLIAAGRTGAVDEAAACCIRLMAGLGRTAGLGGMLLTLWGSRPAEWLVELLAGADRGHLPAVAEELRRCDPPGPQIAAALAVVPSLS
jgi:hypothetical protein